MALGLPELCELKESVRESWEGLGSREVCWIPVILQVADFWKLWFREDLFGEEAFGRGGVSSSRFGQHRLEGIESSCQGGGRNQSSGSGGVCWPESPRER